VADPQRTEQPTQRRLDNARKEGNVPTSKEFVAAVQFLGFLALVVSSGGTWFIETLHFTRALIKKAFSTSSDLTPVALLALMHQLLLPQLTPLMLGGSALVALVVFAQLATTGFVLTGAKLAPDLKRLNFISKITGLASRNLPIFAQALLLLPVVALLVYYEVSENLGDFLALPAMNPRAGILRVVITYKTLLWRVAALFLLVGVIDLVMQRRRYMAKLRMTKQEVREESKEQQGNPQIKARIRRIQRDMARKRMMKDVPKATAVIVNPTHYAVAIRYSMDSGAAPKVVAKGQDHLALRIRKIALENQVPIVENPPLARALYKAAEVGQEIPADLYRAVAEILAYIYKLMGGRLPC
jgi:flagellar biosynthetic protein FlhB